MESAETLVARACALVPLLRERAARTEAERRVPEETVEELRCAGLLRAGTPHAYGGNAPEIDAMFEIAWELSRGCGSTGWCYAQWTVHNWIVGHYPERAQEEYYATGPDTLCSSGLSQVDVRSEPAEGGYRVSGRWEFSSGCDAATWAYVALPATPNPLWAMIPRSEYEIDDTWYVSGLRGSGSKDLVIKETFIPSYRVIDPERSGIDDLRGWDRHRLGSYRVPLRIIAGWTGMSSVGGIAQAAVEEFTERLRGTSGPGRTAGSVALQLRLADASAAVDAAHALLRHNLRWALDKGARGEPFTALERSRSHRDAAYAARLCVGAVNTLFEASGAHGIADSQPIQRLHRDVHAGSHHASLNWDAMGAQYGRVALGAGEVQPRQR